MKMMSQNIHISLVIIVILGSQLSLSLMSNNSTEYAGRRPDYE